MKTLLALALLAAGSTAARAQVIYAPPPTPQDAAYTSRDRALDLIRALSRPIVVIVHRGADAPTVDVIRHPFAVRKASPTATTDADPCYFRMRDVLPPEPAADADAGESRQIVITPTTRPAGEYLRIVRDPPRR